MQIFATLVVVICCAVSGTEAVSGEIWEHTSCQTVSCSSNQYLDFTYAFYGIRYWCDARDELSQLDRRCHGKQSCSLCATNSWFGDPCVGTRKKLWYSYTCRSRAVNGAWSSWGGWSGCSRNCGSGTKTRYRSCNNPAPSNGGANCPGSSSHSVSCNTHHCPINGGYTSWGSWGSCTRSCGSGTKSRSRSCTNPRPQHGGRSCSGSSSSSTSCNTHHCPIHGGYTSWGSWGSCTRSCGSGTKSRSRSCTNPRPQHGGRSCSGSSSSSTSCNTHNCPIHGGYTSWGSWGSCSKTCAGGTKTRSRSCTNPAPRYGGNACSGSASSSTSCNTHNCPIHGGYTSWGSWGSCSKTCAGGTKTRSRSCTNPAPRYGGNACSGSASSSTSCNTHNCPIHGGYTSWGSWGSCSKTCAGGTKTRSRSCTNPAPRYGGNACSGSASSSTSCNTHNCPIHGGYTSWGSWGSCSKTCGGGTKIRSRSCTNPAPRYGGNPCSGSTTSSTSCNTHNCPIHGGFTSWGAWGTCTVTCGGGTKVRSRSCTNPTPQYGGNPCTGATSSSTTCNTHHCPIDGAWAAWGNWGQCTVTCAGGIQTKTRTCSNPTPQYGGKACPNFSSASQVCNTHNCPIDGSWSAWGSWTSCTVTCGGGTKTHRRTCTNPSPQYGGANCPGSDSASQSCNTQHCPIDGAWATWGAYGPCTVTCGGGTQERTRTCTNPAPQYGGAACPALSTSSQSCNTQVCIIDGAWGAWGPWGSCSKTCASGRQSRSRTCNDPAPANGGKPCSGSSGDFSDCNTQDCPTVAAGTYQQLCPSGYFTCQSGSMTCIQQAFVCDCAADCDDGSDETSGYGGCSTPCLEDHGNNLTPSLFLLVTALAVMTLYRVF